MNELTEIWEQIQGFGDYQISNHGRVKSFKYKTPRILKQSPNAEGYMRIVLYKNKKAYTKKVHRLIAQAFISNPQNFPCINHKNGIKIDNRIVNLEWCTYKENHIHARKIGLYPITDRYRLNLSLAKRGEKSSTKLKSIDVIKIRDDYAKGAANQFELVEKYLVGQDYISRIVNKKVWRHLN
ncbi:MAG: NUMOD4 motif-containing HNH endonuclease [Calditrichaeota bacterium]|nr:NUMOD4 motif-containing HNH endonuclease [Calditrichota bacterium]